MLTDSKLLAESRECLTEEAFTDDLEQKLATSVLAHFDRYGVTLSESVAREYLRSSGVEVEEVDSLFQKLADSKPDTNWVRDRTLEHYQALKLQEGIEQAALSLGEGTPIAEVKTELLKALTFAVREDSPGQYWEDDVTERLRTYRDLEQDPLKAGRVPTGFAFLDAALNGGLGPGEEGVLVARPNGGKSTVLVNFGKAAVRNGFKVAHLTFEMSGRATMRRYDQVFTSLTRKDLARLSKTAYDRLSAEIKKANHKRLVVKEFPTGGASVVTVDAWLNTVASRDGFRPDLILIDYAQLMASPAKYNDVRHELAATHRGLVRMAKDRNVPVWTAHQSNRSGIETELLSMLDLAECFEINAIADVIVGQNQKPEELDRKRSRLNLIKNRDGIAGVWCEVLCDYSTSTLADL